MIMELHALELKFVIKLEGTPRAKAIINNKLTLRHEGMGIKWD